MTLRVQRKKRRREAQKKIYRLLEFQQALIDEFDVLQNEQILKDED